MVLWVRITHSALLCCECWYGVMSSPRLETKVLRQCSVWPVEPMAFWIAPTFSSACKGRHFKRQSFLLALFVVTFSVCWQYMLCKCLESIPAF